jgi:hypothetical protein
MIKIIILLNMCVMFYSINRNMKFTNARDILRLIIITLIFILGATVIIWPEISSEISRFVGVGRGVDFMIYIYVIINSYLILMIGNRIQKIDNKIKIIIQEEAIKNK